MKCLIVLSGHDKVSRRLGNETDEQREQSGRNGFAAEHITPAFLSSPHGALGVHHLVDASHDIDVGVLMTAQNHEVDEINHQLAKDNGKLIPRHEHAANLGGSNLTDVHGADSRCQTHAHTADNAVEVEGHEQFLGCSLPFKEQELGTHAAQRRQEEQDASKHQRTFTAKVCRQQA